MSQFLTMGYRILKISNYGIIRRSHFSNYVTFVNRYMSLFLTYDKVKKNYKKTTLIYTS
jgi:hypothetical protein